MIYFTHKFGQHSMTRKKNIIPNFVEVPWVKKNGLFGEAGIVGEPLFNASGDLVHRPSENCNTI